MKVERVPCGPLNANSYVVCENGTCIVIDPADFYCIKNVIDDLSLKPLAILLTHGHFDHTFGHRMLKQHYDIPSYIHEYDFSMINSTDQNCASMCDISDMDFGSCDFTITDKQILEFDQIICEVIHTPGHTKGSVCYKINNLLFSGDTLFNLSIGRTDLYSSNSSDMKDSIKKLAKLPNDLKVFPGHGETTTLDYEIKYNPYFNY